MQDYRLVKLKHSPKWYVEWREAGKPKRVSTGEETEKAAKQWLTAFRREHEKPTATIETIPQILDYYYENHAKDLASAEQAAIYIEHLKRIIGAIRPDELTLEIQRGYIKTRRSEHLKNPKFNGKPISDETLNSELTRLSAGIRFFYDDKNLQFAPPRVKLLKRSKPRDRWLTRPQLGQLIWALYRGGFPAKHLLLFAMLGRYSGPRPGQITSLTWDRVDFESRAIWYFDPDDEETNKRAEVVDMDDRIYDRLKKEYARQVEIAVKRARRTHSEYVEPTHVIQYKGKPVVKVHKAFKRYTVALGWKDVTPNTLRHTFATHAARHANEVDLTLMDLMRAMGHSSIKTTMRYAKHFPGQHRKVLAAARKKPKKK